MKGSKMIDRCLYNLTMGLLHFVVWFCWLKLPSPAHEAADRKVIEGQLERR